MTEQTKKQLRKWAEEHTACNPFYDLSSNAKLIRSLIAHALSGEIGFDDEGAWGETIPALKRAYEWFEEIAHDNEEPVFMSYDIGDAFEHVCYELDECEPAKMDKCSECDDDCNQDEDGTCLLLQVEQAQSAINVLKESHLRLQQIKSTLHLEEHEKGA